MSADPFGLADKAVTAADIAALSTREIATLKAQTSHLLEQAGLKFEPSDSGQLLQALQALYARSGGNR